MKTARALGLVPARALRSTPTVTPEALVRIEAAAVDHVLTTLAASCSQRSAPLPPRSGVGAAGQRRDARRRAVSIRPTMKVVAARRPAAAPVGALRRLQEIGAPAATVPTHNRTISRRDDWDARMVTFALGPEGR